MLGFFIVTALSIASVASLVDDASRHAARTQEPARKLTAAELALAIAVMAVAAWFLASQPAMPTRWEYVPMQLVPGRYATP